MEMVWNLSKRKKVKNRILKKIRQKLRSFLGIDDLATKLHDTRVTLFIIEDKVLKDKPLRGLYEKVRITEGRK
jgi:hypothetical protein